MIILTLQIVNSSCCYIPSKKKFVQWIKKIFLENKNFFITVRIVNKREIQKLNLKYRKINKPTNVLSFPYNIELNYNETFIGDLVLCSEIIFEESKKLNVTILSHWAHISIHGILHLIGYTHDNEINHKKMKNIESKIMIDLGYKNPYK
ncbi:Endoribonuclease YbeY [Buchnera aphidicola (Thelaxes suberi)]|uniref:rRNA maturation RNase YbeY n=1 Tax=Buchnera aphidicola TaxID=9 RepID=UPI0034644558